MLATRGRIQKARQVTLPTQQLSSRTVFLELEQSELQWVPVTSVTAYVRLGICVLPL